jgi:D-xylose 1-dehydrogenase (NADP+, D-xylono-1,5-lactone-forming)
VTEPVRWGVLSTAGINRKVLAGARGSGAVSVVAVASRDGDRAAAFAAQHGIPRWHAGYPALLDDPDVEAVYLPLPNALHHEWTLAALRAGKHVLCEKPYSRHPEQVTEAFALARSRGLVLSEAFMYRYSPQIRRLAELVADGTIGELRLVTASFSHPMPDPADIRAAAELGGGSLMDVGCYCVSAVRLLAGEPERVTAQVVPGPSGVDFALVATLGFPGGVLAHVDSAFRVPNRSHLEVVGERGTVRVSDPWHGVTPGLEVTGVDGVRVPVEVGTANPYQLELEEFGAAVRGLPSTVLGEADALGQARTIEALYRSAAGGVAVPVVPATSSTS